MIRLKNTLTTLTAKEKEILEALLQSDKSDLAFTLYKQLLKKKQITEKGFKTILDKENCRSSVSNVKEELRKQLYTAMMVCQAKNSLENKKCLNDSNGELESMQHLSLIHILESKGLIGESKILLNKSVKKLLDSSKGYHLSVYLEKLIQYELGREEDGIIDAYMHDLKENNYVLYRETSIKDLFYNYCVLEKEVEEQQVVEELQYLGMNYELLKNPVFSFYFNYIQAVLNEKRGVRKIVELCIANIEYLFDQHELSRGSKYYDFYLYLCAKFYSSGYYFKEGLDIISSKCLSRVKNHFIKEKLFNLKIKLSFYNNKLDEITNLLDEFDEWQKEVLMSSQDNLILYYRSLELFYKKDFARSKLTLMYAKPGKNEKELKVAISQLELLCYYSLNDMDQFERKLNNINMSIYRTKVFASKPFFNRFLLFNEFYNSFLEADFDIETIKKYKKEKLEAFIDMDKPDNLKWNPLSMEIITTEDFIRNNFYC